MDQFLSETFRPMQVNPWVEVSTLAAKMAAEPGGVCNLGQGLSDMMAPTILRDAMKEVMTRDDFKLHECRMELSMFPQSLTFYDNI